MNAHHTLIRELVSELRATRLALAGVTEQLEQMQETANYIEERASERRTSLERQLSQGRQEARDAQADADYRESRRLDALSDLQRYQRYADEYHAKQAQQRLREWS